MENKKNKQKDKFIALYNKNKTDQEIGNVLGISVRTVQTWASKYRNEGYIEYRHDSEIIAENVKLAKQKQRTSDLNRISNKSFREHARIENAVVELQKKLITVLEKKSLPKSVFRSKRIQKSGKVGAIVHLTDLHFNELIDLMHNKYDFNIASQRLKKFVDDCKKYLKANKVKDICIAMTGDLINSDRRLDEILSQATNRAKAVLLSVTLLEQVLLDFQQDFNVSVAHVVGNESRITHDIGWTEEVASDNYDTIIHGMLKQIFKKSDIKFFDGNSNQRIIEIVGQNVLLQHGHQRKSTNSSKNFQATKGLLASQGINIDFIISGHFHNCLSPKTPVMVKNKGWVLLDSVKKEDIVYGYKNGNIVESKLNNIISQKFTGKWYKFDSQFLSQEMTEDHHLYDRYDNYMNVKDFLLEKSMADLPCSANPIIIKSKYTELSDDFLRLLVAVCADGSYDNKNIRFHFRKERKIKRLRKLMKNLGYEIRFSKQKSGTYKSLAFDKTLREKIISFVPEKKIPNWFLRVNSDQRNVIIKELVFWDGSKPKRNGGGVNSYQYSSSKKEEINIIQEVLLQSGIFSCCHVREHEHKNHNTNYVICFNDRKEWQNGKKIFKTLPIITNVKNKHVMCLDTTTNNFFIQTLRGKTELTGNCKLGDTFAQGSSLAGANAYSNDALQLESRASQNLHFFFENGNRDSIKIDLQNVDGVDGYPIDKELECYNAKSVNKSKKKVTIHRVVI